MGVLKPRLKDYDTGVESGDDLEEEDFSVWVYMIANDSNDYERDIKYIKINFVCVHYEMYLIEGVTIHV